MSAQTRRSTVRLVVVALAVVVLLTVAPARTVVAQPEFPPAGSQLVCSYDYRESYSLYFLSRPDHSITGEGSCTDIGTGTTYSSRLEQGSTPSHQAEVRAIVLRSNTSGLSATYWLAWQAIDVHRSPLYNSPGYGASMVPMSELRGLVGTAADVAGVSDPVGDTAYPQTLTWSLHRRDDDQAGELLGTATVAATEKQWCEPDPVWSSCTPRLEREGRALLQLTAPDPLILP